MATKNDDQQGVIFNAFAWLFGANWQTTLSSIVTVAALAIHEKPVLIAWVPEPSKGFIWNLSEYVFAASLLSLGWTAKSKNVSGGTVQQDADGNVADPQKSTPAPPKPALPPR